MTPTPRVPNRLEADAGVGAAAAPALRFEYPMLGVDAIRVGSADRFLHTSVQESPPPAPGCRSRETRRQHGRSAVDVGRAGGVERRQREMLDQMVDAGRHQRLVDPSASETRSRPHAGTGHVRAPHGHVVNVGERRAPGRPWGGTRYAFVMASDDVGDRARGEPERRARARRARADRSHHPHDAARRASPCRSRAARDRGRAHGRPASLPDASQPPPRQRSCSHRIARPRRARRGLGRAGRLEPDEGPRAFARDLRRSAPGGGVRRDGRRRARCSRRCSTSRASARRSPAAGWCLSGWAGCSGGTGASGRWCARSRRSARARSRATGAGMPWSTPARCSGMDRTGRVAHARDVVGGEHGREFLVVQQVLLDRVGGHVRPEVLPVREVPQRGGDVVGRGARVAERRDVEVDLRRRGVLHRLPEPGAELALDHGLELDRVQPHAAHRVRERALPVVGGHEQRVLAGELADRGTRRSCRAPRRRRCSIRPSHFGPMP